MAVSKRTQARNEKTLQELLRNVPGNERCADCAARNPGWASWSLGIFLCMRCASLHRKLGTHVSKVKSLSMDTWTNEQVENMRLNGNTVSNRIYNPQNKKPSIPLDVDEVDHVLENFIRHKYSTRTLDNPQTSPDRRRPSVPPRRPNGDEAALPMKPPRRLFGLRSASSSLPPSRKSQAKVPQMPSPDWSDEPARLNKQSRVFGALVGENDYGTRLAKLRELGYTDERRNLQVLRSLGGNLDAAVARLGERNGSAVSADTSPLPSEKRSPQPSYNPFDRDSAIRLASVDQAFSSMHISQTPLFPHATGGYPHASLNPYLQSSQLPHNNPFFAPPSFSTPASPVPFTHNPSPFAPQAPSAGPPGSPQYSPHTQQMPFAPETSSFPVANPQPLMQPYDKQSILALYDYPQLAPQPEEPAMIAPRPSAPAVHPAPAITGSKNPFQQHITSPGKHTVRDSVDLGSFQSGRHSPDAFANLSARLVR